MQQVRKAADVSPVSGSRAHHPQGRSDAWRAAHRRLYEHLCKHKEGDQPTLEDLQPLYQAVAHGCQAGLQQEAYDKVWVARVRHGNEYYSTKKLGVFGSDLGATACFFDQPWNRVSQTLTERTQGVLLNEAAYRLRGLGRLTESLELMRGGIEFAAKLNDWRNASAGASNLSELELTLGEVAGAVGDAEQSVTYADRSGDASRRMSSRTTHADALHQAGRRTEAETRFREAEQIQQEMQPDYPLLCTLQGFQYCDLLLAVAEQAAWRLVQSSKLISECRAVSQRTAQTLKWVRDGNLSLLPIALDHLTLGRAALYEAILSKSEIQNPKSEIEQAVSGLRRASQQDEFPKALLTRVWLRFLTGACTGPESAQADLDEAWEIAERGPMRLFMADIHLYRARLFGNPKSEVRSVEYPWGAPTTDLLAARKLIEQCGYWRRKEELEHAERVIGV